MDGGYNRGMSSDEVSQKIEQSASIARDFVREIPDQWKDIFWLTIFVLPFVYITSVAIFTLAEGLSFVTNNWLAPSEEMAASITLLFVLLISFLIFIVLLVSSVVTYQIIRRLLLMPSKTSEKKQ